MSEKPAPAALLYLETHPNSTTSDVAKAVFDPEDDDELRSADRKVRYYFEDKFPHLIDADENGKTTYRLKGDMVEAGLGRLEIQSFEGDELSIGLGGVVVWPDSDGDAQVSVVGEVEVVSESE